MNRKLLNEALDLHDEALRELRASTHAQDRAVEHALYAETEVRQVVLQIQATNAALRRAIEKVLDANRKIQEARSE